MAQIPPIDDAYINEIIKSNGPYNPALLKTQGVKMRELIKLLRDRMEQGDAEAVHKTGDESISGTKTFALIKAEGVSVNNLANPSLNTVISPTTGVQTKLLNITDGALGVQLSASVLAASRSQLLQDKDGVIALTSDLSGFATLSQFNEELALKINNTARGVPGGVSTLDSGGKIPASQLPDSISGALTYRGTWNATTNTPALADPPASSTKGYYYVTNTAGTQFGNNFGVGDWIVSNGAEWQKVDNTDAVTTVFGRLGNILANEGDYSAFYPLLSGSYADPSWITSLAYSKLTGVPSLTGYVPYYGATTDLDLVSTDKGIYAKFAEVGHRANEGHQGTMPFHAAIFYNADVLGKGVNISAGTDVLTALEVQPQISFGSAITFQVTGVGAVTGLSFTKTGGTSSQFLKADGSVDNNTYLTATDLSGFGGGTVSSVTSSNNNITVANSTTTPVLTLASTISSNTTGNAATASYIDWLNVGNKPTQSNWASLVSETVVVGMLSWKNYRSNHVIFDASAGTSPSGSAISQANSENVWTASFPTLMGWNGTNTYGVRVDTARYAESAANSVLFNGRAETLYHRYAEPFGTDANTIGEHTSSFTYAVNAPYNGTLMYFGAQGYGTQFNTRYDTGSQISFRVHNGDNGTWGAWRQLLWDGFNSARAELGGGLIVSGGSGTSYNTSDFEVRSSGRRPVIGLHWAGAVASTITLEASGRVAIMNNPGTGYESLVANGISAIDNFYVGNYGSGLIGQYDATKYQAIFSMGSAYAPTLDGTSLANMYGLAWSHENAGGQTRAGFSHQLLFTQAGAVLAWMGNGRYYGSGDLSAVGLGVTQTTGGGTGLSLYNGASGTTRPDYGIMFATTANFGTYGVVSGDWATYFTMTGGATRGWIFRTVDSSVNVAAINSAGSATFAGYVTALGGGGTSDARYKNIVDFDFDLGALDDLQVYQYKWKDIVGFDDGGRQHWGYMAQDVEKLTGDLILGTNDKKALNKEELLILEVKRLKERVTELEIKFNLQWAGQN